MYARVLAFSFFIGALLACNPFAPTPYELTHGVSISPADVTVGVGTSQTFTIHSAQGRYDELRISTIGVESFDEECPCEQYVRLGTLRRIDDRTVEYIAPVRVTSVSLPATMPLHACSGGGNSRNCVGDLAQITIVP